MTPKPKTFQDQGLLKIRAVDDSIHQDGFKEVITAELWVDNAGVWTKMTQPGGGAGGGGVAQVQVRSAANAWTDVGYAGGDLRLPVDPSGVTSPISAVTLPLPTGASTEVTIAAIKAKTDNLDVLLSTRTKPADSQHATIDNASLAITAAALPLPTGAAQDRTTFAAPAATRLSTGAAFYDSRDRSWTITETVPISAVALPLPAGAAADATLTSRAQKAQLTDGTRDGTIKAASTLPLATDTALVVTQRDPVAVTGTFFQATQPISVVSLPLPTGAATQTTLAAISAQLPAALVGARLDTNVGAWLGSTVPTVGQKAMASSIPVAISSDQSAVPVTPPTLTKNAQGATGFSTQSLRDAGRNTRIFMLDAFVAAPVAEALQTVVQWYGNAAVAGTTTPAVVPAGKTLRLTGWRITYRSIATFGSAVIRIRANTGGVAGIGSPMVASFEAGSNLGATTVAIVGAVTTEVGEFPEGLELPAGTGVGFTMAGYGPTGVLTLEGPTRFEVHGYEY